MKKFILIFLMFIISLFCASSMAMDNTISIIEGSLFGYDYSNESDVKRIERIEEHIYGAKKTGNINTRIQEIKDDIGYSEPQLNKTAKNSFSNQDKENSTNQASMELKEDSTVEYPMVDNIEREIFNTTYKNENIYSRLNRLEQKVFNKVSDEDLNTRVDRLASVVVPSKTKKSRQQYYSEKDLDSYYSNSGLDPINAQSLPFQLSALEEDLLNKSYMDDNNSNRLARLEQKLFKKNFPNDSDVTRLQRVMVAYDAKKNSYKYENNKKMQNMATISQVGGILLMILAILL